MTEENSFELDYEADISDAQDALEVAKEDGASAVQLKSLARKLEFLEGEQKLLDTGGEMTQAQLDDEHRAWEKEQAGRSAFDVSDDGERLPPAEQRAEKHVAEWIAKDDARLDKEQAELVMPGDAVDVAAADADEEE